MHPAAIRVCLVEDSSLVRLRLAGLLGDLWDVEQVFEAATVAEARQLLPRAKPHLVVVDMRLPDGDGLEVVAAAKLLKPRPAVVVAGGRWSGCGGGEKPPKAAPRRGRADQLRVRRAALDLPAGGRRSDPRQAHGVRPGARDRCGQGATAGSRRP